MSNSPAFSKKQPARLFFATAAGGLASLVPAGLASLSLSISRGGFCLTIELLIIGIGMLAGLAIGSFIKNLLAAIIVAAIAGFFLPSLLLSFHANSPTWWSIVDFVC